jgi:hypothetical protein
MQETLWAEIKNCHVLFGKYTLDSSTRYKTISKSTFYVQFNGQL